MLESDQNQKHDLGRAFATGLFSGLYIDYKIELNRHRDERGAVGWITSKEGPIKVLVTGVGEKPVNGYLSIEHHVYVEPSWLTSDDAKDRFAQLVRDRTGDLVYAPIFTFYAVSAASLLDEVREAVTAVERRVELVEEFSTLSTQLPVWTPAMAQQVLKNLLTPTSNESVKVQFREDDWYVTVENSALRIDFHYAHETRTLQFGANLEANRYTEKLSRHVGDRDMTPDEVTQVIMSYLRKRILHFHFYSPQDGEALLKQAGLNPQILQGAYAYQ